MTEQPTDIAGPDAVRQATEATAHCRTCRKFRETQQAVSALADVDALPASVYFRILQLLNPGLFEHVRRFHPALHHANRSAAAARQAALGMQT